MIPSRRFFLIVWIMIVISWCGYVSLLLPHGMRTHIFDADGSSPQQYGAVDFIQYWSAYRVQAAGKNPYAPSDMSQVQVSLGVEGSPTMMWNPPWILLLMEPVLAGDFSSSVATWYVVNLIFILLAGILCSILYPLKSRLKLVAAVAVILFPPFWDTLYFGQVSLLITVLFLVFAVCLKRRWDFMAGIFFAMLSIKPHLVYLLAVVLLWWVFKQRRYLVLFGLGAGMSALVGSSLLLQGQMVSQWLSAQLHPESINDAVRTNQWVTATIGGALRAYGGDWLGSHQIEFMIALGTLVVTACWLLRAQPVINWQRHLPLFVVLSLLTAPYGWFFDQSIAIIAVAYCIWVRSNDPEKMLVCLFSYYAFVDYYGVFWGQFQHQMFFFPLGLLVLLLVTRDQGRVRAAW